MARPLLDGMEANYSLLCTTCQTAEEDAARAQDRSPDEAAGDLSEGGNNLNRRQATMRAAAHLRKNPTHELSWTAMGCARLP